MCCTPLSHIAFRAWPTRTRSAFRKRRYSSFFSRAGSPSLWCCGTGLDFMRGLFGSRCSGFLNGRNASVWRALNERDSPQRGEFHQVVLLALREAARVSAGAPKTEGLLSDVVFPCGLMGLVA